MTVAVFTIKLDKLLAALSLFSSCTKRMPPEMRTKTTIIIDVVGSSSPGFAKSHSSLTKSLQSLIK